MILDDISKLISLILAISLASERLVTFLKTLIPWLAGEQLPGQVQDPKKDRSRQLTVLLTSFMASILTAYLLELNNPSMLPFNFLLMGFLASGGSAFWASLLGYTKAVKDIKKEQFTQEKLNTRSQFMNTESLKFDLPKAESNPVLKKVIFKVEFSGGPGTLRIQIPDMLPIDFNTNGTQEIDLPVGVTHYVASGGASPGPGGACILTISGDVETDSPLNFGPGAIPNNIHPLRVLA